MSSAATDRFWSVRLSSTPLFFSRVRARVGVGTRGGKSTRRGGNHFVDVLAQSGLIVLHGQLVMRSVFHDQLPRGLILGMERIHSHRASRQIQVTEKFARYWDLVGLGVDQCTAQVKLAGHADRREDGVTRAVPGFFAVNSDQ